MKKQFKLFTLMLAALLLSVLVACGNDNADNNNANANKEDGPKPVIQLEDLEIKPGQYADVTEDIDKIKDLEEGTILVNFNFTDGELMSLFSLSQKDYEAEHFHLYITETSIGSENRTSEDNIHVFADDHILKSGEDYTLAFVVDKDAGYKFFLDGELIKTDEEATVAFFNNVNEPNAATVGRTDRSSGNKYPFRGKIDLIEIYDVPLDDNLAKELTSMTKKDDVAEIEVPDDVVITEPQSLFYPGYMDSKNYRIPALLYTKKGTLLAGIDRRVNSGDDSPADIDAVLRRSFDEGDTWEEGIYINAYPDERASNIDIVFVQDESNERIFALVDGFPYGAGLMGGFGRNSYKGTGFKEIDGEKYMYLLDEDDNEFTIREDGIVYDPEGNVTDYKTDLRRNLYLNDEEISNVFSSDSPLKAFKTSYLELYHSDDEGETWTGPVELNGQVKEEWMMFLGTGPGNGIQLTQAPYEGRLIFPVYFLNDKVKQASAVIYSDDNGETWHRGESPNEGRDVGDGETINEKDFTFSPYEVTESQAVEMPDGQVKLFMRNHSGFAQIATSFDGGETWDPEVVTEEDVIAPYSQMSAIRYNGEIDGKQAVIFSSANDPKNRVNGTVRVGLIEEDGTHENGRANYVFDWKYEQLVKEGLYGYSSLTNLADGEIGLFYEGTSNTEMDFIRFNTNFLKWDRK